MRRKQRESYEGQRRKIEILMGTASRLVKKHYAAVKGRWGGQKINKRG